MRRQPATVDTAIARSLAEAKLVSFWLDQPEAPEASPALAETTSADLAIVGGGFTGLWTALLAKERDPSRDVVLLEAKTVGHAASGRNGGFCSASLTHGIANGLGIAPGLPRPRGADSREHRGTNLRLAEHFFAMFPQLEGVRFTHAGGGVIDTCSRFSAFFGTAHHGRLAYAAGYTGLGVGATRFGAQVILDLLDGCETERTRLALARSKPVSCPTICA